MSEPTPPPAANQIPSSAAHHRGLGRFEIAREFYSFIAHQGIIGLAIGFLFGTAISELVSSFVSDIVDPLLGLILINQEHLATATFTLGSATIAWGKFFSSLIDFFIMALVVFFMMRYLHLKNVEPKVSLTRR